MTIFNLRRITRETDIRLVEYHASLESTSALATELLPDLLPHCPALVLTPDQTDGRGRGSNSWWAAAGSLTCTLVLNAADLDIPAERRPLISLAAGIAVRRLVARLAPAKTVRIKWPNDVYVGTRKVCGILTEQRTAQALPALLVGIGVNVNNSLAGAPDEIRQRATSIFDTTGETHDLTDVLTELLNSVHDSILDLSHSPATVLAEANANNVLQGRRVTLQAADQTWSGKCTGIDERGALVLETTSGVERLCGGAVVDWE